MIPKKIHYCWFGGKDLPKSAKKCIESWKKYFPDYEIKRWDESNFDVNIIPYTAQAYEAKKYAFVSDFARFWILYKYGGLYFDTDVEVIKPMDDIIAAGPFMGCENSATSGGTSNSLGLGVNPGLGLGVNPGLGLVGELMSLYRHKEFANSSGIADPETVVTVTTDLLCRNGLQNVATVQEIDGVKIYPSDFFCPISTKDGKLRITDNTRSIHWYDQSWQSPWRKYGRKVILTFGGVKFKEFIKRMLFK